MTGPVHFIEHRHITHDTIRPRFDCTADLSAPCRQWPACECEDYHVEDCARETVARDECKWAAWMNETCAEECFVGEPDAVAHSGPIVITWNGDCADWNYAEP